jgi:hypothetical protein
MCEDDGFYPITVLQKVREIGYDDINAVHLLVRKAQTAVDDDDVLAVLVNREVFPDFVQAAERDYFQF